MPVKVEIFHPKIVSRGKIRQYYALSKGNDMAKYCKRGPVNTHKEKEKLEGWDIPIADAEMLIKQAKARIRELKAALGVFRDRKASGEKWPGGC